MAVHSIGNHDSGIMLTIDCTCGEQHEIELDAAGHWKGRCDKLPTDQILEVQLDPPAWREIMDSEDVRRIH